MQFPQIKPSDQASVAVDVKGSEAMLMVGMIGAFVTAAGCALDFLKFVGIRTPGIITAVVMLLGLILLGVGFLAVGKVKGNGLAKVAGILFCLTGVIYGLALVPVMALAVYSVYGMLGLGAVSFLL